MADTALNPNAGQPDPEAKATAASGAGDEVGAGGGASPAATPLVPDWLTNVAALGWRVLAVAGFALVFVYLIALLWVVAASIAVAVIVSAVFAPLVLRLRRRGYSRTRAAATVWAVAIGLVGATLVLLGLALLPSIGDVLSQIRSGVSELQSDLADLQVPDFVGTLATDFVEAARSSAGDVVSGIVNAAAAAGTVLILATFLVFYFLRDGDKAWLWMFQNLGDAKRERITTAGDEALARVGGYLRGTTVLSGLIAITDLLFMLLLGVPLAVPLALLVFLAGYIPYVGGAVTTIIILIITFGTVGPIPALVLLVLIGIRNVILGYGVRPSVYGRTVDIHPALVLAVLPAGYELAGAVGLFAAVPLTAVLLAVSGAVVDIVEPVPPPVLPGLVPPWLDRMAQFSWRLLVVVALIGLFVTILTTVPLVVIPVLLSTILAATFEPIVRVLLRRGWSRGRAAAVIVVSGFVTITVIMTLAMVSLVQQTDLLSVNVNAGAESASDSAGGQLDLAAKAVADGTAFGVRAIIGLADDIGSLVVIVILSTLLAFYFLRDGGQLWARLLRHVRSDVVGSVESAGSRAFDVLGGYMIGTAAISFVGAFSQWVIMVVLGLPLALPVFVLSFFLSFIPYIGGFISTGIAFLITIAVGSTADIVIMAGWTILFNIVTGNVVAPLVYGKTVHIHPAIVLVAIPAGSAIAGILGMFIIVPVLGVVAVTWRTLLSALGSRQAVAAAPQGAPQAALPATEAADTG